VLWLNAYKQTKKGTEMDNFNLTNSKVTQKANEAKQTAEKAVTNKWSIRLARLGYSVSGLVYGGLAIAALSLLFGTGNSGGGSDATLLEARYHNFNKKVETN
jgi:hypothetical protein